MIIDLTQYSGRRERFDEGLGNPPLYLPVMIAMLMSHCATVGDGDKTWKGTGIGALGGAAAGALIGAAAGNPGKGALIGAAAGAAVGTVTGVVLDRQEEQWRKEGIRTERDRQGNLLVRLADDSLKFDTGKAELKSAGVEQLSVVSGILRDCPENRINIMGHTDSVGSDAYNQQLSQARADTVKVTLLQQGVPRGLSSPPRVTANPSLLRTMRSSQVGRRIGVWSLAFVSMRPKQLAIKKNVNATPGAGAS
jgi:outer membrane protein OmpA-like peptidoglycan-associated protein